MCPNLQTSETYRDPNALDLLQNWHSKGVPLLWYEVSLTHKLHSLYVLSMSYTRIIITAITTEYLYAFIILIRVQEQVTRNDYCV